MTHYKKRIAVCAWIVMGSLSGFSQTSLQERSLSAAELQEDFEILQSVLNNYHPGLYRYQDSTSIANHFTVLHNKLNTNRSTTEFYLMLSKFSARLACGHTYCNFYNQNQNIQDSIFNLPNKVPFTFQLLDKRMMLDKNLSDQDIKAGSEIIAINDIPVSVIIDSLLLYIKGDGSNNGKRLNDLALSGLGKFEAFDIFFPLLFPPQNSSYTLTIIPYRAEYIRHRSAWGKAQDNSKRYGDTGHEQRQFFPVQCVSRAERLKRIEQKYGKQKNAYDDLWNFKIMKENTAYLQLGTFVTNQLTIDWKKWLANAFDAVSAKDISNLIIDLRGNEGGNDEVNLELAKYLASKQITFPKFQELLVYEKVADDLIPYLKTWDDGFYDRRGKLTDLNNGFYTWKKDRKSKVIRKRKQAFLGELYLLVDAANSSATFFLATGLRQNGLATIIGEETGGNRKGTNGGQLFFLTLPNSQIEIDIPLIGYFPLTEQPDAGLMPDIVVLPTFGDMRRHKDVVLAKTLELIDQK